jgi:epoxyqueuosine reductase
MPMRTWAEQPSRRDFLKGLAAASAIFALGSGKSRGQAQDSKTTKEPEPIPFTYQYRTVSVKHLGEMKAWLAKLDREGKLSDNKIFRSYIKGFQYEPPPTMPDARSLIVLAIPITISSVTFHLDGQARDLLIPCGYVDNGITEKMVGDRVMKEILKDPAAKLEEVGNLPVKTLANFSGLATHGKNNISFVDGYGSYYDPHIFYTNKVLPDQWGSLRMLRECKGCSICMKACPTQAIRESNFVIEVGKCLPLYNERPEPLPEWLDPKIHHAMIGCLRCQYDCPANAAGRNKIDKLGELDDRETRFLLNGGKDEALRKSIAEKLRRYGMVGAWDLMIRNFKLAWANAAKV